MDDSRIIEMLFGRTESALSEISDKYSRLYKGIIKKFADDERDAEECENDLLLAIWNSIPPNRPTSLAAYICKIARRIGIDKLRHNKRKKRDAGYLLTLSELEDCIPAEEPTAEDAARGEAIREVLSDFLRELDPVTEILFVRRYVYLESVTELSERFDLGENRISVKLYRARKKLKRLLEKEGIIV